MGRRGAAADRPWDYPANASRVFHGEGGGIWLRRGWYPAEQTRHGPGNWAGPVRRSDVAVRRAPGQDELVFDVIVINGITFTDIVAYDAAGFTRLPLRREEVARDQWRYRVDLTGLPEACEIALMVPNCYAPINVFAEGESASLERRSFLAAGWSLAAVKPAKPRARKARPGAEEAAARPAEPAEALPAE